MTYRWTITFIIIGSTCLAQHPLVQSFQTYRALQEQSLVHLPWVAMGPVMNSARVEAVQVHPTNAQIMYVAFGSGNLWKTNNGGVTWRPIYEDMPSTGIGDFALAPSDPDVIYLGTGESLRKNRNFTMPGCGVYRSDDAGETWRHIGLDDSWHIGEIAVHPHNPEIAFVAVMGRFWTADPVKGVYRTLDGGATWDNVLYVDADTRANDIVISPSDPDVIYASMWENNVDTVVREGVYGPKSGIYRSLDGGDSWQAMNQGLPHGPKRGRIGLAVSHQNPDKAYALIDNLNNERAEAAEVYQTLDGGKKWTRTHEESLLFSSVIGWYFADIYVSPLNDDEIFALGVRLAHSTDGGKRFRLIGGQVHHRQPSQAQTLHLDHCELWLDPQDSDHLVLGNDGGLYTSRDKGKNWQHHNNIPAGEFYTMTIDQQAPYLIYGGTQDNSTVHGPLQRWTDGAVDQWKYFWIDAWSGGDGCVTQLDVNDANTVYFSSQEGAVRRRDVQADTSKGIRPALPPDHDGTLQFSFVAPYLVSHFDSRTLYHAGNYVFRSQDRGDSWEVISPDLTVASEGKAPIAAGALAESPHEPGRLYVGTDHGTFWMYRPGKDWVQRSQGLDRGYIRSIVPSQHTRRRIYLTMTGLNYDDFGAYVYRSDNEGKSWSSISRGLPEEALNVILEDPIHPERLYLGSQRGVYISHDEGAHWETLGHAMPAIPVADLGIVDELRVLVAATHGRGCYMIDLKALDEATTAGLFGASGEYRLFQPDAVPTAPRRDTHRDVERSAVEPLLMSFWAPRAGEVLLALSDASGQEIWTQPFPARRGLNQYHWDQVLRTTESNAPYFINYHEYIKPGDYTLHLRTSDEQRHTVSVSILK